MGNAEKLAAIMTAVDKIVESKEKESYDLFPNEPETTNEIKEVLGLEVQDPQKSYLLFYENIQQILHRIFPEKNTMSDIVHNLICTMLSHCEKACITSGKRGADSRMATTKDMENVVDILLEWSNSSSSIMKLALDLLNKNKELGYSPEDRTLEDYMK